MEKLHATQIVNVDEMLSLVGEYGPFQWTINALFCVIIIPPTLQILLMYFAALNPTWKCAENSSICLQNGTMENTNADRCGMPRGEWEYTEPINFSIVTEFDIYCDEEWQIHLTTSILFIGWAIGAVVIGWFADNYGRKKVLFPSLMIGLIVGLICAFMQSIYPVLLCRFIIGFCIPGSSVQVFVLLSEIVGSKYRPLAGISLWFFFTVGLCILALKTYFIRTWKMLMISCTAPYLLVILSYKLVPESVKWLHVRGKTEKTVELLHKMSKWNKKEYPTDVILSSPKNETIQHKSNILDLFKTPVLAISSMVQGYNWFANALVYYGISLAADDLGGSLYTNYVLVSAVEFPGAMLAIYLCGRIGRKKTVMIPMLIGSATCVLIAFVPVEGSAKLTRVILGMLGKLCITISFDSLYTWSVELYPTMHRATGMGFLVVTSRIGAASSPWIAKGLKSLHKSLPFIVMGSIAFVGACLLIVLPETKYADVESTNEKIQTMGIEEKKEKEKEEKELYYTVNSY